MPWTSRDSPRELVDRAGRPRTARPAFRHAGRPTVHAMFAADHRHPGVCHEGDVGAALSGIDQLLRRFNQLATLGRVAVTFSACDDQAPLPVPQPSREVWRARYPDRGGPVVPWA